MVPPFEHMLRNAVVHGIETPEERIATRQAETRHASASACSAKARKSSSSSTDDGARHQRQSDSRDRALELGLHAAGRKLTDEEAMQLILEPGFSTAGKITQPAGRGVGMDVVATEIKKLAARCSSNRSPARARVHHPPAVHAGDQPGADRARRRGAVRAAAADGRRRACACRARRCRSISAEDAPTFEYGGQKYRFQHLGASSAAAPSVLPEADVSMSVMLVRAGEHSTALVTDELIGSREIVVKTVGPQISGIRGISGATILGDGRIVMILDMGALVRSEWRGRAEPAVRRRADGPPHVRAGGGRFDHRAPRDAAPARTQRHARA